MTYLLARAIIENKILLHFSHGFRRPVLSIPARKRTQGVTILGRSPPLSRNQLKFTEKGVTSTKCLTFIYNVKETFPTLINS
jgi:hypothetical protein